MTLFSNIDDDAVVKAKDVYSKIKNIEKSKLNFDKIVSFPKFETFPNISVGLKAIANGEVGLMILSGGQGSRLGIPHAKGVIDLKLGLSPGKDGTLSYFGKRIQGLERMCQRELNLDKLPQIPVVVMTSSSTHEEIEKFFNDHIFKDNILKKDQVIIEPQLNIPCLDMSGNVIKKSSTEAQVSPNGNGGFLDCLKKCDDFLRRKGIKYIHVIAVDNCLSKVCDPSAIGCMVAEGADILNKVVKRRSAFESCGVMVKIFGDDGSDKAKIIEYSEMPKEVGQSVLENGELKFPYANICSHYFNVDWLRTLYDVELPYHEAIKKIPYYDEVKGELINVDKPNGIKLEKFIFDVFNYANKVLMIEVPRSEEFSPIKNADSVGVDCISSAVEALGELTKKWMFKNNLNESYDKWLHNHKIDRFFIDPRLTYDGEGPVFKVLGEIFESGTKGPEELTYEFLCSKIFIN